MNKTTLYRRCMSLLLSLALIVALAPAARAAAACPSCKSTRCTWTPVAEATCHEPGVDKCVCSACGKTTLTEKPIDAANHDAICTDTGDGLTHTATCPYHSTYTAVKELHTFSGGRCTRCLAVDYSQVKISLPTSSEVYAALGDSEATLTLDNVSLSIGSTDVTGEYNLSYSWYYQGSPVGSGAAYRLPASLTSREGDLNYVCFVMAVPKSSVGGKPISASCTVTVHVRDLITAYAAVTTQDMYFSMGDTNSHTPASVTAQIYQAVYLRSGSYPTHLVFGGKPSSRVGSLKLSGQTYYFTTEAAQSPLSDLRFEPTGTTGSYVISFTAYGADAAAYPGTLTITVEQALSDKDILSSTTAGVPVGLEAEDFAAFWEKTYRQGELTLVRFTTLPDASQGALCYGYTSSLRPGTQVETRDPYYLSGSDQALLEDVKFVPAPGFSGCVAIPFEAYGQNNRGVQTYLSGNLLVLVSQGAVKSISYRAGSSGVALSARDFLSVYQSATGSRDTNFYIQLLNVPASGALYTAQGGQPIKLTAASIVHRPFYHSSGSFDEIGDLTYIPGSAADAVQYVAYDGKGALLYMGEILLSRAAAVTYTKSFTDVPKTAATEWYYTAVMDLAEVGIINGTTPTTFTPDGEVKYGEALKLIMMAAGYEYQEATGQHWASGFLSAAHRDSLISTSVTESYLDRKISRNVIAQIATRALKLPQSTLEASPFSDVAMNSSYAPYILPLYETGIVVGSPQSDGTYKYYGVNSIRRSEMAVIIWRMNNYHNS